MVCCVFLGCHKTVVDLGLVVTCGLVWICDVETTSLGPLDDVVVRQHSNVGADGMVRNLARFGATLLTSFATSSYSVLEKDNPECGCFIRKVC
uniref:Uncharacterized protein n=1 Tax=Physcomitrium patens TaxID=3218 RepID=A0A2K1L283_PHYPA|nr:hypothetical protein PHYPA_002919 [Physcomitrium patens]